ncbi:S1 RNA-binding domain-containing protein [Nonomuraea turkmeniaca]|uniref:S1 RNA-binding domain-containing protein n=1 Tax=Nonomuraea turkmeniaca TaxID=103838 RepID=UPI001B875D1E|nr:S1 RNA-binding domain-containing protein [Nonomuraea turkmeniaca]
MLVSTADRRSKATAGLLAAAQVTEPSELSTASIETPDQVVQEGEEVTVIVTDIDLPRRRLALSRRRRSALQ